MTSGNITLALLYRRCRDLLRTVEPDNAANEAAWLMERVFGLSRQSLLAQGSCVAEPSLADQLRELTDRRLAGVPLQYLLGEWEFYGLPLFVGPGVLIPRPETELLVELTIDFLAAVTNPLLLDLCSGSGCIPLAIGSARPDALLWGVELSEQAFPYFQRNCHRLQQKNVTPVQGDIFLLPATVTHRRYHAITANPPYIAAEELATLSAEVSHEPVLALDGGSDGLAFYRHIPALAATLLAPNGLLALEIGNEQGAAVAALVGGAGFDRVTVHPDLSGNDRVVTGVLAPTTP
ncbi:MAG: peptide chain release factor N(5)-glutamine methyltransferase [Angelakisella sp.]